MSEVQVVRNEKLDSVAIKSNAYYVLIPFLYESKVEFDSFIRQKISSSGTIEKKTIDKDIYLSFINTLFKKILFFEISLNDNHNNSDVFLPEIQVYYFNKGIGFFVLKYLFDNETISQKEQGQIIREIINKVNSSEEDLDIFKRLQDIFRDSTMRFFPGYNKNQCLEFSIGIGLTRNSFWEENCEEIDKIGANHYCFGNVHNLNIVTNAVYKKLDPKDDIGNEIAFRNNYEENSLLLFMLLHHERQMYLYQRERLVENEKWESKKVKDVKQSIIELLAAYSYSIVTEESELQSLYAGYRDILGLNEYEKELSELVEKLDEENERRFEKKLEFISVVIAVIGLLQFASTFKAIFDYLVALLK